MTRSEFLRLLASKYPHLPFAEVERYATLLFQEMVTALAQHRRIELRGFGSFSVRKRKARVARNPRNQDKLVLAERGTVYFRAGKELKQLLNVETPEMAPAEEKSYEEA